jgi:hypothetical protein
MYFTAQQWTCRPTDGAPPDAGCPPHGQSPGIDEQLQASAGVPFGSFGRTGFNYMRLHCQVRGAPTWSAPSPSLVWRCSHRNAWAGLHLLGRSECPSRSQSVRAMTLANPSAPVRPWLDYRSYAGDRGKPAGPTDHYQERTLHLFLTGAGQGSSSARDVV